MPNDIDQILSNLVKTKHQLGEAKKVVGEWTEEIGYQENMTDLQTKVWVDLKKNFTSFPSSAMASGASLSQRMVDNSQRLYQDVWNSSVDQSVSTAGTTSEALSAVSTAVVYTSYGLKTPQSYIDLTRAMDQRSEQDKIADKLEFINPSLKSEYLNAWSGLHTSVHDSTRAPMFLIREVVRILYEHYAPDQKVLNMLPAITDPKNIHRSHRVEYIASTINPWVKQTFLDQEKAFNDIYSLLSKAHKDGVLSTEETRSILYLADSLIKLLFSSLGVI